MKKTKSKKFKRLLLKAIWFGVMSTLVCISGTVIFLALLAINDRNTPGNAFDLSAGNIVMATVIASVVLISSLLLIIFITRKSNKTLLRWARKSLTVLAPLVLLVMTLVIASINQEANKKSSNSAGLIGQQGYVEGLSFAPDKLLAMTNSERAKNGKSELGLNTKLNDSALLKCEDMVKNNYWSHNDKNDIEPWRFMEQVNYGYGKLGENLAYGYTSESAVTDSWMNSEEHRKNILDETFMEVGFGVCASDNFISQGKQLIVVQHFGQPISAASPTTSTGGNAEQRTELYKSGECSQAPFPYKTRYENNSYLAQGQQKVRQEGVNGYITSCTPDTNGEVLPGYTYPGYDKIIEVGTYVAPSNNSNTPQKNYSQCNQFAGTGAYQSCIDAINAQ